MTNEGMSLKSVVVDECLVMEAEMTDKSMSLESDMMEKGLVMEA